MNINLEKLKRYNWFEDSDGNIYNAIIEDLPDKDFFTYHVIDPCKYVEEIDSFTCHPEYRHKNNPFYQAALHFKPFRKMIAKRHRKDLTFKPLFTSTRTYGSKHSQDCIVAMVNSGDFTLAEAIYVYCTSCERCMNVLLYKYLNGRDGYEEYSEEWSKVKTSCDFCS